jgi:hypothetical protein
VKYAEYSVKQVENLLWLILCGTGLALLITAASCGSIGQETLQPSTVAHAPQATGTGVWLALFERTPYPYATALPTAKRTPLDGVYAKLDPRQATPVPCKRCADYAPQGGIWKLGFDRGIYRILNQASSWRSLGSFTVTGERLVLFNDPHCPGVSGFYTWTLAHGALVLEALDDSCAIGQRAKNLTQMPWGSCQPPNAEAASTDHWPKPPGCDLVHSP